LGVLAWSAPAMAGTEPLYEPAPGWIVPAEVPDKAGATDFTFLLYDTQVRMEDGRLWQYQDMALNLNTPQVLTQLGTLSADWLPDKGDLIVHRLELVRDGKAIDLIAEGQRFEVLRRERMLEQRMVDGQLTATLNVPGARVGDILRLAYSITLSDQALGEKVQYASYLPAGELPLGKGGVSLSWPADEEIKWATKGKFDQPEPLLKDGYYSLSIPIPIEEQDETPYDAPARFRLPPMIQATNFADYPDLSRTMYPHFTTTGAVAPGGEIAAQVAKIMADHPTPLARAAAATKLVQDEISYLLNGLDGGNYLPQKPAETWEQRYGDCKAKSMLLLAMLREMGIEADPVLVLSQAGDTVTVRLPMASNFDHMMVRAVIDGQTYWLDGTNAGTRLENIADVPRFFYALPLTEAGSELVEMEERPKALPDDTVTLTVDQSAGLFVPGLFEVRIETSGAEASQWENVLTSNDEARRASIDSAVMSAIGYSSVIDSDVTYDKARSAAVITASGVLWSDWERKRGYSESALPAQVLRERSISADRARPEWKELPLAVSGPRYDRSLTTVILPDGGAGVSLRGEAGIEQTAGGALVQSRASLGDGKLVLEQSYRTVEREIPAERIRAEKIATSRLNRNLPRLRATTDARENWQYFGTDRKLLAPIEAALAKTIALAVERDKDIAAAYSARANFLSSIYDYRGAIADYTAANEEEASTDLISQRGGAWYELGELENALADYRTVEEMQGDGGTLYWQSEILSLLGRHDEAIAAAEEYAAFAKEADAAEAMSYALSYAGRRQEGAALLDDTILLEPDELGLLNAACWQMGIFNRVTDATIDVCTQAVEATSDPASALDSRAMAYYRRGEYDKALQDIEAALKLSPAMAGSHYLRGIVRLKLGDKRGRKDIETALAMSPVIRTQYTLWGVPPPK
jgi:tetratricopeptide (TPR) repeat protein